MQVLESFCWTAAIASILCISLFGKIIYRLTNQDLDISNNVTWLSKWHNHGSCRGLSEFSLIANPVFVTSASCQHLSCCDVYQPLFSSDSPWRGQPSSETGGPQVCTPCCKRQSGISPLFSFPAFCLFPVKLQGPFCCPQAP